MATNNCPDPDPAEGLCCPDPNTTLAKVLGSKYLSWRNADGSNGALSEKLKAATWGDLLQAHALAPNAQTHQKPPKLTPQDLTNLMDALKAKYKWDYDPNIGPSACCSCLP